MSIKDFFRTKKEKEIIKLENVLDKLVKTIRKINIEYREITDKQLKEKIADTILQDSFLISFFKDKDKEITSRVIHTAMNLCKKIQVEEALSVGAYVTYNKAELINLGFSKENIIKIEDNNKIELKRLSKFDKDELLEMGMPKEDILKIKKKIK